MTDRDNFDQWLSQVPWRPGDSLEWRGSGAGSYTGQANWLGLSEEEGMRSQALQHSRPYEHGYHDQSCDERQQLRADSRRALLGDLQGRVTGKTAAARPIDGA